MYYVYNFRLVNLKQAIYNKFFQLDRVDLEHSYEQMISWNNFKE